MRKSNLIYLVHSNIPNFLLANISGCMMKSYPRACADITETGATGFIDTNNAIP